MEGDQRSWDQWLVMVDEELATMRRSMVLKAQSWGVSKCMVVADLMASRDFGR